MGKRARLLETFRAISWNDSSFQVLERTQDRMTLSFSNISLSGENPCRVDISFARPVQEWAMLWQESAQQWVDHPDRLNPIGSHIVEAFAKPQLHRILFSFAGNHESGWSRWGFAADAFSIVG